MLYYVNGDASALTCEFPTFFAYQVPWKLVKLPELFEMQTQNQL